jgi:hypothetical protein
VPTGEALSYFGSVGMKLFWKMQNAQMLDELDQLF